MRSCDPNTTNSGPKNDSQQFNRRAFLAVFGIGVGYSYYSVNERVRTEQPGPSTDGIIDAAKLVENPRSFIGKEFSCWGELKFAGSRDVPVLVGGFHLSSSAAALGAPSNISQVDQNRPVFQFGPGNGILAFRDVDTIRQLNPDAATSLESFITKHADSVTCKITGRIEERKGELYLIFSSVSQVPLPDYPR
jgi:hypothetical protein